MPEEIELKLAFDPKDVALLRRSRILKRFALSGFARKRLITTYYDTSSLSLLHNDIAFRVRKVGRDYMQSIKIGRAESHYPLQRAETENSLPTNRPNLDLVKDPAVRRLIEGRCNGERLRPVFSTNIIREIYPLKFAGSEIECSIDRGFVAGRGKKAPICELEFELQSGEPSALARLARRLIADVRLRLEATSKAARGYVLISGARPEAPKAAPIGLDESMSAWDCLQAVLNSCTAHLVASANYAFTSEDPEGVHQLRVALRRTRAAFSIIRRHVGEDFDFRIVDDLRSLQQKLGRSREWDVLVNETLRRVPKRLLSKPVAARLKKLIEAMRVEGHKQANVALRDRLCTDLLLRLAYWFDDETKNLPEQPSPQGTAQFAAVVIEYDHRKARKLGRKIRTLNSRELHGLRIRIKKLRYATEFFGGLWADRRTRKYLAALKDLQQALGAHNDTRVATRLVTSLHVKSGSVTHAIDPINRWLSNKQKRQRLDVICLWGRFARRKSFWKRGRLRPAITRRSMRPSVQHTLNGESVWRVHLDGASHLERFLPGPASQRDVQALDRFSVR